MRSRIDPVPSHALVACRDTPLGVRPRWPTASAVHDASALLNRLEAAQRLECQLEAERSARERANRLLVYAAEASALLAHDLNNGFAAAIANVQYIQQRMDDVDGDTAAALESVLRVLRRMSALASNLVDVGRIEEGALIPSYADVDVAGLVGTVVAVHEPTVRATGARIDTIIEDRVVARLDSALIERILHNLLGNAARYVGRSGRIAVVLAPDAERDDRFTIEVTNSGPPIPPQLVPVLFEKYRTGMDGRAMRGMGLYFCRLAVECHGGTIAVDAGTETRFRIRLPR